MNKKVIVSLLLSVVLLGGAAYGMGPTHRFGFANTQAQPYVLVSQGSGAAATTVRMFGTTSPQAPNISDLGEPSFAWRTLYTNNIVASGSISGINLQKVTDAGATTTNIIKVAGLITNGEVDLNTILPNAATLNLNLQDLGQPFTDYSSSTYGTLEPQSLSGGVSLTGLTSGTTTAVFITGIEGVTTLGSTPVLQFVGEKSDGMGGTQSLGINDILLELEKQSNSPVLDFYGSGGIQPTQNNIANLGAFSKAFQNVYVSSTLFSTTISNSGGVTIGGNTIGTTLNFTSTSTDFSGANNGLENNIISIFNPSANIAGTLLENLNADAQITLGNTKNVGRLYGGYINADNYGSGNIVTDEVGLGINANNAHGSHVTELAGIKLFSQNATTGTVDLNEGLVLGVGNNAAQGTITNNIGLSMTRASSGTVWNNYGIKMEDMRYGTSSFAFYSAGGDVTFANATLTATNASFTGLTVNGLPVTDPLAASSISFGNAILLAGNCTSTLTTVTGATTAMAVVSSPVTYPGDGTEWESYVSAADTVTTKVCAIVGLTPTASIYRIRVIQ